MTPPRYIIKDRIYFITRRTHHQLYRLRPTQFMVQLFTYLLALIASRFQIEVIGYVCMSNHYHLLVWDKEGRLPRFLQWFNSLLARAVNCADDQREAVWSKASTDVEWVPSAAAVMQKLAYIAANPVSTGAVRNGRDWPGARSNAEMFGKPHRIRRPRFFFGEKSCLPQAPHLQVVQPPTHAHLTPAAFRAHLADAIHRAESAARDSREEAGLSFQGPKSCAKADPMWIPSTHKDPSGTPAPVTEPNSELRAVCLAEVAGFREAYAETLARWQSGRCDVKWPKGTWKLVHILRVPSCRATPARAAPK